MKNLLKKKGLMAVGGGLLFMLTQTAPKLVIYLIILTLVICFFNMMKSIINEM